MKIIHFMFFEFSTKSNFETSITEEFIADTLIVDVLRLCWHNMLDQLEQISFEQKLDK